MFEFIKQELTEARLFKYPENLEGRDAQGLGQMLFASLMALEILRHEMPTQAYQYVVKTMVFGDFEHMRPSCTDIGNLVAVLGNQQEFADDIKVRVGIYAPLLQIKTYLRGYMYGADDEARTRRFFMEIERDFAISNPGLRQARRVVVNWQDSSPADKRIAASYIRAEFTRNASQLDIWKILQQVYNP